MNIIEAYLKAFRYKNLLIIILTMYLMRLGVMIPFIEAHQLEAQMSDLLFAMLVLSVVMVAAGGYIINDYFDLKIDRINKPDKIIVGRYIKRRVAIAAHWFIHALGLIIGGYVAWKVGVWQLVLIHLFIAFAMWFYSVEFKSQLLIGNIVIAICLALVPLTVFLFEWPTIEFYYGPKILKIAEEYDQTQQQLRVNVGETMMPLDKDPRMAFTALRKNLFYWILGFSGFAFFMTLAREITKDAADIIGDKAYRCITIPIKWGITNTKTIISVLYVLIIGAVITIQQLFLFDNKSMLYIFGLLIPMLFITAIITLRANGQGGFKRASTWNKITSIVGVCYAIIVYFQLSSIGS